MYRVRLAKGVEHDLRRIRADHRSLILEGIEEMLTHEPTVETRNRKQLVNLIPPFEAIPPVWELRIASTGFSTTCRNGSASSMFARCGGSRRIARPRRSYEIRNRS